MSKTWFYQLMGAEFGPLSSVDLRQKVVRGEIAPDTPVRLGTSSQWVNASEIKGLFEAAARPTSSSSNSKLSNDAIAAIAPPKATSPEPKSSAFADEELLDFHAANEDYEFFRFVGFRQAITSKLFDEVDALRMKNGWTMTQITRRALAQFVGKPELAEEQAAETTPTQSSESAPVVKPA